MATESTPIDADVVATGDGLDPDDERIIGCLAVGYSHAKAADEVGVSTKTIQRRLQNPEFQVRLSERKRDLHAASWAQLLGLRERASAVLSALLDSDDERIQLQTARTVYDIAYRIRREQIAEELNARVDQLELTPASTAAGAGHQ